MIVLRRVLACSVLLAAFVLTGCGDDDSISPSAEIDLTTTSFPPDTGSLNTTAPGTTDTTAAPGIQATEPAGGGEGCWVHLFEEENFDESDEHFRLTQPGRYADLDALPGTDEDWDDEAESIRVGPAATVTLFADSDFQGETLELGPGSERADLGEEPESLELRC